MAIVYYWKGATSENAQASTKNSRVGRSNPKSLKRKSKAELTFQSQFLVIAYG